MQRMLAVDDEQPILTALHEYFGARDFDVDCARSLEEARAYLDDGPYALVVTDLKLDAGGSEGFDVVRLVRERHPAAAAILLTAHSTPEVESEARRLGVGAVLTKPQTLRELARCASSLLDRTQAAPAGGGSSDSSPNPSSSAALYRALVETSLDPFVLLGHRGDVVSVSPSAALALGSASDELVGRDAFERIHPEDVPAARMQFAEILARPGVRFHLELRVRHNDGDWLHLDAVAVNRLAEPALGAVVLGFRDVTDRRRSEQARERAQSYLAAIVEGTTDVVYVKDLDGRYRLCNAAGARLAGLDAHAVIGRTDEAIYPPELARACRDSDAAILALGAPSTFEETAGFDGATRTFLSTKGPLRDGRGRAIGIFGISRDITAQKTAELTLRESEERYRLLFDRNPQPMWVLDQHTLAFLAVNEAAVRTYGYAREEFLAMTLKDIRPPEDVPALLARTAKLARDRDEAGTWRHCKKDGSVIEVQITTHALSWDGRAAELVLAEDVTVTLRAERALRESEERYRGLFENHLTGDFVSTPEGRLLACNRTFARIFGFEAVEAALATSTVALYHEPSVHQALVAELQAKGRIELRELELRRCDGAPLHVLASAEGSFDADGRLAEIHGVLLDETQRKLLEQQFHQAQKMEAVGRLAGGVAHDFNNLLGVILGYAEILRRKLPADERLLRPVTEIAEAARRATGLTRQLLAFSRKQVLAPQVLDLNALVTNTQRMLERLLGEDIEVVSRLAPDLARVHADSGQIDQILVNLAVNARDAMPQGGRLTIVTENVVLDEAYALAHESVQPGPRVMLAVTDSGSGMSEEVKKHLFEPFFTTKPEGKGTGLGLATVYGIVKQSGGHIWVYSEPGLGTTFKVYLPPADAAARPNEPETPAPGAQSAGTETVLLVEDLEMLGAVTAEALAARGYSVLRASNGNEALEVAASHDGPIHLLLTDVVMPGMGGPPLAAKLAALRPETRLLYMSGFTDDHLGGHGVLGAGIDLIQKPFSAEALSRRIREVLDRKGDPHVS